MIEIEKITFEFLWNGKDRIKRKIMVQDYKNGGIRMTNYRLFVKAQRISWLTRLLYGNKNMGWKMFFDYCCKSVGGKFIFLCDYVLSNLNLNIPTFYLDILKAWEDFRECRNMNGKLVNPIIFSNRNICSKGKMFFNSSFFEKGIHMVDQLERGRVKPLQYFLDLGLNSTELLTILDIYKAIPDNLIHESASDKLQKVDLIHFDIELEILGQKMNLPDVHSKKIYNYFVNNLQIFYSLQIKDVQSNFGYTEEEIKNIFLRPRSTTLIGKHREFQYILLHGVLYTKEHLSNSALSEIICARIVTKKRKLINTYFCNVQLLKIYGKR